MKGVPTIKSKYVELLKNIGMFYNFNLVKEKAVCLDRKWRYDLCDTENKLAVEYEGGTFSRHQKSGHTTGIGFHKNLEKYNRGQIEDYYLLRFDVKHMSKTGQIYIHKCFSDIRRTINERTRLTTNNQSG